MDADATLPPVPARTLPLWWDAAVPLPGAERRRAVVLVPDAHRCAGAWPVGLVDGLVDAGHRPVLVDLRDQGRSPWCPAGAVGTQGPGRYRLEDVAADLVPVLAALRTVGPRPPILLGHGFGASVAFEVAEGHPDLVAGLVAVGASGWVVDPTLPGPEEPVAVGLIWRARLADAGASGGAAEVTTPDPATSPEARDALARALARELRLLCTPDDDPGGDRARDEVVRWLDWGFNPADRHRAAWVDAEPAWAHLARRRHPLVAVHGDGDPLLPLAHGERLAAEAGAPLRVVGGGGHALTPAFVPAVLAAVDDVAATFRGSQEG